MLHHRWQCGSSAHVFLASDVEDLVIDAGLNGTADVFAEGFFIIVYLFGGVHEALSAADSRVVGALVVLLAFETTRLLRVDGHTVMLFRYTGGVFEHMSLFALNAFIRSIPGYASCV